MQLLKLSNTTIPAILDDGWIIDLVLAHNTTWTLSTKNGKPQHIQAKSHLLHKINNRLLPVSLHRIVFNYFGTEFCVDHINGDVFDNRLKNLRLCTRSQNAMNRRKAIGCSSYKNVFWDKGQRKWGVTIKYQNSSFTPPQRFDTEREAALLADDMMRTHHGAFARLNFPEVEMATQSITCAQQKQNR